ncbi:MAG: hypothetical protein ACRDYA_22320 [Egibacteraceae bacterium]
MDRQDEGKPFAVVASDDDPPVFSCADCGWTPGYSGTPGPLFWSVIVHWLIEHWEWGPGPAERDRP